MKIKHLIIALLAFSISGCAVGHATRGGKKVKVYRKDVQVIHAQKGPGNRPCSEEW